MTPDTLIAIGRIIKSRGLNGELVVKPLSDDPERFKGLDEVVVTSDDGASASYKLSFVRTRRRNGKDEIHLRFDGVDSRDASDELRGRVLKVTRDDLDLEEGEHFLFDLIGLAVTRKSGETVGRVKDVRRLPAQDIIVVVGDDGRESLIPDVPEFVDKSRLGEGKLIIAPIDGLLED